MYNTKYIGFHLNIYQFIYIKIQQLHHIVKYASDGLEVHLIDKYQEGFFMHSLKEALIYNTAVSNSYICMFFIRY